VLVIPATVSEASELRSRAVGRARSASKAGIHLDLAVAVLGGLKRTSPRRADTLAFGWDIDRFRPPQWGPSHFSLLVQKKSNQKKRHPGAAPCAHPCAPGARVGSGVSRRYVHVSTRNSRTSCARPFGLSCAAAPRHRGPKSARFLRAEARAKSQEPRSRSRWIPALLALRARPTALLRSSLASLTVAGMTSRQGAGLSAVCFCAQGCAPLSPGPLGRGEVGSDQPVRGARRKRARFRRYMDVPSKTPAPTHGPGAQARAWMPEVEQCRSNCRMRGGRVRGVSFLLPTSLWTSTAPQERRERRRRPGGRRAGCPESREVGRRALSATKPGPEAAEGERIRPPWRSRRFNPTKKTASATSRWIPAFAGMTRNQRRWVAERKRRNRPPEARTPAQGRGPCLALRSAGNQNVMLQLLM
jgi:hypothetical protein